MSDLALRVAGLCGEAARSIPDQALADEAGALAARLAGPLRLAFAGRVKAGKSTLLNALVGERMAPTDAGECTRVVTWYRKGPGYEVHALLRDGALRPLRFRRDEMALDVDLGGLAPESIERLDVQWPSSRLGDMTLIDTPGLASVHGETSALTERFLALDSERATEADAVIYLMRHAHRRDVEFLDAFMDRSIAHASPLHAVGVLSRADEIGGGRLDALASAARIADRYRADRELRSLCSTIVPVAGLLAETGVTLREDEFQALRSLAAEPDDVLDAMLVTADRFVEASLGPLTVEMRHPLLERFGLFGLRFAVDALRSNAVESSPGLSAAMVRASGLDALRAVISTQFLPRARVLQARAALAGLRALVPSTTTASPDHGRWLADGVERIEASASELAELRLLHLATSGAAELDDDAVAEVRRLVLEPDAAARLALAPDVPGAELQAAALRAAIDWHQRGADPFADPITTEACELAARTCEAIYASAR